MKEHFNRRSLIFYACAIGSVVTLFSVASAYGEKNLKASRPIDGRYALASQTLPGCSAAKELYLLVQQSGVYLTGSILPEDASEQTVRVAEERPSLSGQWNNPKLQLHGQFGHGLNCQGDISIEGNIIEGNISEDTLNGTLRAGSSPDEIAISAKREAPQPRTEKH